MQCRTIKSSMVVSFLMTIALSFVTAMSAPQNVFTRRYLWLNFDHLGRAEQLKDLKPRTKRAADAGYNGVYLRSHFHKIKNPTILATLKDYVAYAKGIGMAVSPVAIYVGEVSDQDPMQAEAFPVKGTQFLVTGTSARVKSDHTVVLQNGGFDTYTNNIPTGWKPGSLIPGQTLFMDTQIKHSGAASVRVENPSGYLCRLEQRVTGLKPYRAYELSMWVRTENYTRPDKISFFVNRSNGKPLLLRRDFGLAPWNPNSNVPKFMKYTLDFNSLEVTQAKISVLFAELVSTGKAWVDNVSIREVGLYETIRRPSCPVTVVSKNGKTIYAEGKDYTVKTSPIAIHSGGGGQELAITAGSRIKSGDHLIVDWYQHANTVHYRATTNYASIKALQMQMKNITYIDQIIGKPKGFYAFIDEWREAGWDANASCFPNAGEYMGWVAAETEKQIRSADSNRDFYLCSDMYDPYHNAIANYGTCRNGTLNSWKRVPTNAIILNWCPSMGAPAGPSNPTYKSLMFFGGLDPKNPGKKYRQVISPAIGCPGEMEKWEAAIADGEKHGLTGVTGFAYVVWGWTGLPDYSRIETDIKIFKNNGRWGTGPIPFGDVPQKVVGSYKAELPCIPPSIGNETKGVAVTKMAAQSPMLFAGAGMLKYSLPHTAQVTISLVNAVGRTHVTIEQKNRQPGIHTLHLDSHQLPSGVYFARMVAEDIGGDKVSAVRKVALF